MQDIINNTKNDVKTYQSLSHYLYNVLLNAHNRNRDFDFFNVLDWLLVLAVAASFLALILVLVAHLKLKSLFLLLSRLPTARSQVPQFFQLTSPTTTMGIPDYMVVHKFIKELMPIDMTILFCLIVFIIGFTIYLYRECQPRRQKRTTLLLEISDSDCCVLLTWIQLPLSANWYSFTAVSYTHLTLPTILRV